MDEIINEIATIEIKTKKYYTDANFNELDNCDFIGISNQENLYKDLEMLLKFLKSSIFHPVRRGVRIRALSGLRRM